MRHAFLPLLLTLAAAAPAAGQPRPAGATHAVVTAFVDNGELVWDATNLVAVTRVVNFTVLVDGRAVTEPRTVIVYEKKVEKSAVSLKLVKVTDAFGNVIVADRLPQRLGTGTPVVLHSGPLAAEHRKLFRDDTILVEFPITPPVAPLDAPATAAPPAPIPASPKSP